MCCRINFENSEDIVLLQFYSPTYDFLLIIDSLLSETCNKMAAARQLGAKMKKMQIPDVDPVSNLLQYKGFFLFSAV